MPVVDPSPTAQRALLDTEANRLPPAAAKVRILDTANRLFYEEGIRSVGVDKLISESSVTKATFYKHYGAKDTLIVEYLRGRHRAVEHSVENEIASAAGPEAAIRALVEKISVEIHGAGFRGCPFINAAAEFSDPRHSVRQIVSSHRDWYTEQLSELLRDIGHPLPGDAADDILLARDGAMSGGYAGDPISASAALHRAVDRILADARG